MIRVQCTHVGGCSEIGRIETFWVPRKQYESGNAFGRLQRYALCNVHKTGRVVPLAWATMADGFLRFSSRVPCVKEIKPPRVKPPAREDRRPGKIIRRMRTAARQASAMLRGDNAELAPVTI